MTTETALVLDLDNIQGFVLRGYRMPVASYVFLRVDDAAAARGFLADIVGHVTTAAPWEAKPASTLNVALAASGLRALRLSGAVLDSFPVPFAEGMSRRAAALGDTDESAPKNWEAPFGSDELHLLVLMQAVDPGALSGREQWLASHLPTSGCTELVRQPVATLPGGSEHFGFADGFSQPVAEGLVPRQRRGHRGADDGSEQPLRAGEFVLGYLDEEGVLPATAPRPDELAAGGSYLAYRKLHEDVAAFRAALANWGTGRPGGEELAAAKVVGRWRDGTPLALSPEHPDPALATDDARSNAFSYADDPDGYRCPLGAHIRRANPRDTLPFDRKLVDRHRLIRRGLPYGPPLPPGAPDDGAQRGVVFMCLQADLARQFEFVQSQWLATGNAFRLGDDRDPLTGAHDGTGKFTVNGAPPRFFAGLRRWVTTRGGEYFFVPGISGLRWIASQPDTAPDPSGA